MRDTDHATAFRCVLDNECGQGLVEYALILALVVIACIIGLHALGSATRSSYSNTSNSMNGIGS